MPSPYQKAKYTRQMVVMISVPVSEAIDRIAKEQELSKSAVVRAFLHAGMDVAGYGDVPKSDETLVWPVIQRK